MCQLDFIPSVSSFVFLWTNPSLLEYLRWFRISDFSLTGSCEFLQVGESLVRVCHRFASACVFRLLSVGIPSADSRPELCGTGTHCSRRVRCNRDLFLSVFESDLRLPFTLPLVACPVLHTFVGLDLACCLFRLIQPHQLFCGIIFHRLDKETICAQIYSRLERIHTMRGRRTTKRYSRRKQLADSKWEETKLLQCCKISLSLVFLK